MFHRPPESKLNSVRQLRGTVIDGKGVVAGGLGDAGKPAVILTKEDGTEAVPGSNSGGGSWGAGCSRVEGGGDQDVLGRL